MPWCEKCEEETAAHPSYSPPRCRDCGTPYRSSTPTANSSGTGSSKAVLNVMVASRESPKTSTMSLGGAGKGTIHSNSTQTIAPTKTQAQTPQPQRSQPSKQPDKSPQKTLADDGNNTSASSSKTSKPLSAQTEQRGKQQDEERLQRETKQQEVKPEQINELLNKVHQASNDADFVQSAKALQKQGDVELAQKLLTAALQSEDATKVKQAYDKANSLWNDASTAVEQACAAKQQEERLRKEAEAQRWQQEEQQRRLKEQQAKEAERLKQERLQKEAEQREQQEVKPEQINELLNKVQQATDNADFMQSAKVLQKQDKVELAQRLLNAALQSENATKVKQAYDKANSLWNDASTAVEQARRQATGRASAEGSGSATPG